MREMWLLLLGMLLGGALWGQIYVEKQTRHRFAQMNFGVDVQTSFGGETQYLDEAGNIGKLSLNSSVTPRILIGGTHFWGHADFYLAIPLVNATQKEANQEVRWGSGVETIFKYYPWRIVHNKVRPYLGLSLSPFYYEQDNGNLTFGNGPERNTTSVPLYGGLTFNKRNHLVELSAMWNYNNRQPYAISRSTTIDLETPPLYLSLSYRYMLETTLSAEKSWESGATAEQTEKLAAAKKLNSWYLGVGLSSAFWLKESSYNQRERPYIGVYNTSVMPDFTLGYYFNEPDINVAMAYRGYRTTADTYGVVQELTRRSLVLEATKYLFDYHGFVPFVGPAVSWERLAFRAAFENQQTHDLESDQIGYGLTFGWDIRPNRLQTWILRTNLRWFPNLELGVDESTSIAFDNIEFNFIQLVIYPGRM